MDLVRALAKKDAEFISMTSYNPPERNLDGHTLKTLFLTYGLFIYDPINPLMAHEEIDLAVSLISWKKMGKGNLFEWSK